MRIKKPTDICQGCRVPSGPPDRTDRTSLARHTFLSKYNCFNTMQLLKLVDLGCGFKSPKYELIISDGDPIHGPGLCILMAPFWTRPHVFLLDRSALVLAQQDHIWSCWTSTHVFWLSTDTCVLVETEHMFLFQQERMWSCSTRTHVFWLKKNTRVLSKQDHMCLCTARTHVYLSTRANVVSLNKKTCALVQQEHVCSCSASPIYESQQLPSCRCQNSNANALRLRLRLRLLNATSIHI